MRIQVILSHPSKKSFTYSVFESFLAGLRVAGHEYEVSDLYEMDFKSEMDICQYEREMGFDPSISVSEDVRLEQEKINQADAVAFIYPVWWSDCPAKLKGWFDRVWSLGYAYFYDDYDETGTRESLIRPKKALVICTAGHTVKHLEETGIAQSMRCIMLHDRLENVGFRDAQMEILGGMTTGGDKKCRENLRIAYDLGKSYFS